MKMDGPEYTESVGGTVSPYPSLIQIAKKSFATEDYIVAIAFSAFAWEAILNVLGEGIIEGWNENFERPLSPEGKLTLIGQFTGLSEKISQRESPWKELKLLFKIRNQIVHPKPASKTQRRTVKSKIAGSVVYGQPPLEFAKPKSELESTKGNAHTCIEAVDAALSFLSKNLQMVHKRHLQNIVGYSISFPKGLRLAGPTPTNESD